jgi:hypothetical protein
MGTKAEELGVEIYPGFAASEVVLFLLSCYHSIYYWTVLIQAWELVRSYMIQRTQLLALQLMIWELPKMVQRRKLFSAVSN